jgi:5-methyltetrahydropteroyltriglutamate--homocysteine methyltransferase
VAELVAKQREVGLDVISDGEMSKPGFSSYLSDRFSGFGGGASEFQSDDVAPFPDLAMKLFANPQTAHLGFSFCVGPVELVDKDAVHRDIARFKSALGDADPSTAFMGTISPGQIAFNYPDQHYGSHEKYLAACAEALRHEYQAIIDAGFNLQIDSPDMAMAAHARSVGSSVGDWHHHLPLAVEALNGALEGIPPERIRFHVCWGNTGTPHHLDVPLEEIIDHVLKVNAGRIYVEGGNPRHAHEWRVFRDVELPAEKSVILGVIDVKSNYVEHPRLVADRLVQVGQFVGKDRLMAGTDCGFGTFIRWSLVDPGVMWLKLGSLVEGAKIASEEL